MKIDTVQMPAMDTVDRVSKAAFGAATPRSEGPGPVPGSDFAGMVRKSLDQLDASQTTADLTSKQYQLGVNDVTVEDAMISMQKANISLQTALQVRNKLVTAYNDIMNMQL